MADEERLELLERQLAREQRARRDAEDVAEAGMRRLYLQTLALAALAEVGQVANESTTLEDALERVLPVMAALVEAPVAHALIVSGATMASAGRFHEREPGDADALRRATSLMPFQVGVGLAGEVAATGAPRWVEDVGTADFFRAQLEPSLEGRSAVVVPVHVGDEVVAVVELFGAAPTAPEPDLLEAATQAADLLGRVVERERALGAVREANAVLEARVAERTEELDEARALAEASSRAKTELLANLGHELRTPLAAVLGLVDLARDTPGLPRAASDDLEAAARAARALREQVERLIALADLEAGAVRLRRREVALEPLLDAVVDDARPRAEAKGLVIGVRMEPGAPVELHTDPERLAQAIGALVDNAVKFTERGQVVVAAGLADVPAGATAMVRLAVHDTGVGMDPGELQRMSRAFVSGDAAPSRSQPGMGIGLAIASRLLARLGGRLGARAEPGGGSVFWVDLPVAAIAASSAPTGTAPRRALLVEDNEVNRRITGAYLARLGVPHDTAVDGAEAVRAVASGRYGIVLMDLQMPEVDGYEATARIRALDSPAASVPIVAVTASTTDGDRERCLAAGMDGYLAKPFGRAELAAAIEPWIGAGSAAEGRARGRLLPDE